MRARAGLMLVLAAGASAIGWTAEPAPASSRRNPLVRVVTVSQDRLNRESPTALEDTLERLNQAASFQPDIACLPELFAGAAAETVPDGPVTLKIRKWARERAAYVIFGVARKVGPRKYNSAVLVGRNGEIAGIYDKIHPTEGEIEEGTTPGAEDAPVFDTDFGRIGIQICFDVNWWDSWDKLRQKGARVIFFPSAYPAAQQTAALALRNQIFAVTSPRTGAARIYGITGDVLAISGKYQPWAGAVLPLGERLFEIDLHVHKMRQMQQKYGRKVKIVWNHDDDWVTVASLDPALTVEDLIREYGLLPLDDYRERSAKAIQRARERAGPVR